MSRRRRQGFFLLLEAADLPLYPPTARPPGSYGRDFNNTLKERIRRRDKYLCQLCGVPQAECGRAMSVHHIDYDKENSDPVNLVSLCPVCHGRADRNRPHWTAFFQKQALNRPEELGVQKAS